MPLLIADSGGRKMPAATHWSILVVGMYQPSLGDAWVRLGTLEMAAYPGGPNLTGSGTPYHQNFSFVSYPASNAFDGNPSTFALGIQTRTQLQRIGIVFPSPVSINEMRIGAGSTITGMVNAFTPQWSTDSGSTWNSAEMIGPIQATFSPGEIRGYRVRPRIPKDKHTARIWGITTVDGTGTEVGDLEFRASYLGASLCTGGTWWADDATNAFVSGYACFNGSLADRWLGQDGKSIQYVFEQAPDPVVTVIKSSGYPWGTGSNATRKFDIWWSEDGMTRSIVAHIDDAIPFGDYEERIYFNT